MTEKEKPMTIETRNTCVLAMSRLTEDTVNTIRLTNPHALPFMAAIMGPDMIIAWAATENGGAPEIPADLYACMEWARAQVLPPTGSSPGVGEFGGYDYII